jgi:hypothetical protein
MMSVSGASFDPTHHFTHVECGFNPLPSLFKLWHHAHDVERVHPVNDGGAHGRRAKDGSRVAAHRHRPQLVLAPGVLGVAAPRVTHHLKERMGNWVMSSDLNGL